MVKRQINSFGTITLPKDMRDELGIVGTTMLRLEVRECHNGMKEIVIRKGDDLSEVFNKYKNTAEIISRISECTTAIVWNNILMSMSVSTNTESFIDKDFHVSSDFQNSLKAMDSDVVVNKGRDIRYLLPSNQGEVIAYFRIPNTGDDQGFFVLLKGTKQDIDNHISKAELQRRYEIISDVIKISNY